LKGNDSRQLIGKPIDGTKAYVLNENLQLLPQGMIGELYLSGSNIARGYLNKPELTAERFISNPYYTGERLYKTGDLVRWTNQWDLEYFGRADEQVKLRGFRIELGEIEASITNFSGINEACVLVRNEQLCAYYSSSLEIDKKELWYFLESQLPTFMVPSIFIQLEKLPLTPNGKINKNLLPEPVVTSNENTAFYPTTELETELLSIWKEVLNSETIGVNDNFFLLGGHSLKVTQAVFQIRKKIKKSISMKDFFRNPTITQLALFLSKQEKNLIALPKATVKKQYSLSQQQKRLWLAEQVQGQSATFNMPDAYELKGEVNRMYLEQALNMLIQRHEVLRTVFIEIDGEPFQEIRENSAIELAVEQVDLSDLQEKVNAFVSLPFDLAKGPLLRTLLLQKSEKEFVFVLSMHHIVSDGWSMKIMMQELMDTYRSLVENDKKSVQPLALQYKDYAEFQNENTFKKDEEFWLTHLNGGFEPVNLPYDFKKTTDTVSKSAYAHFLTDTNTLSVLRNFAQEKNTTLSNVVFCVFNVLLSQLTGQSEIAVGITSANRNYAETESMIGFFINTLILKTELNKDLSFEDLLKITIQNVNEALEHQDYPVDVLLDKIGAKQGVNVAYSFQNFNSIQVAQRNFKALPFEVSTFEMDIKNAASKYDLLLLVNETDDGLKLEFEYDASLFKPETASKFLAYLNRFLNMVAEPIQQ
jgi:acyl carrier protein